MKARLLRLSLAALAAVLLIFGAMLGASAYTADTAHPDSVENALGGDRNLLLLPGVGWHHVTAKYFEEHTPVGDGYAFSYGLTLWLNGECLGTTRLTEAESKTVVDRSLYLYSVKNGALVSNTTLSVYFYSGTSRGVRVVMYDHVYEKSYARENVLFNVKRSYLFNGDDIHFDAELYATQSVEMSYIYVAMLPLSKQYANCMRVTTVDGETLHVKTGTVGDASYKPHVLVAPATKIELWGESNSALHTSVEIRRDAANEWDREQTRLWDMNVSSNKVYFSAEKDEIVRGTELHLGTTWRFRYEPDFRYDGGFDHLLGSAEVN